MKVRVFSLIWFLSIAVALPGMATTMPGELPNEEIVEFGEGAGKRTYNGLVIADLPELDTQVIYSRQGFFPKGAKGFLLIYPGTGADANCEFGKRSLAQVSMQAVKAGYAVMAFTPGMYCKAGDAAARAPYLKKYGNLAENLRWYGETIKFGVARERVHRMMNPNFPQLQPDILARSTFGAIGFEALHRYLAGDKDLQILKEVRTMLLIGAPGHLPHQVDAWYDCEEKYFAKKENAHKCDPEARKATLQIFKEMTFGLPVQAPKGPRPAYIPRVLATVGSRDIGTGPLPLLFEALVGFHDQHPGVDMTVLWHDAGHNPATEIRDMAGEVLIPTMARMKPILEKLQRDAAPGSSALKVVHIPDHKSVLAPLDHIVAEGCERHLARATVELPLPPKPIQESKAKNQEDRTRWYPGLHPYMFE